HESTTTTTTMNNISDNQLMNNNNSHVIINDDIDDDEDRLNHLKLLREDIRMLTNDTYRNERIFYGIAYLCIIILSFFGNLLVCKICWQKLTKTNTLIISMAISDLLMTIFNIPFNFFRIVNFSWPFGQIVCFVVNFVQHCAVYISTYTMAIIALQRYYSNKNDNNVDDDHDHDQNNFSTFFQYYRQKYSTVFSCCMAPIRLLKRFYNQHLDKIIRLLFYHQHRNHQKQHNDDQHKNITTITDDSFSMRTIYLFIIIIWIISSLFSWLLTYSSVVVMKKDASYILEILVRGLYEDSSSSSMIENSNDTDNIDDDYGMIINSNNKNRSNFLENFLIDQQQEQNHIYRCRNPINNDIENFIQQTFHIKADLFKTIIVFITQYFIPLSTICYLYIEIGKIIHQQGKLCNVKGNAKTRIRQRKKNRRLLMLILMVMVFAICWLPLHLFHILIDIGLIDYNYRIFMMVHWLAMSSVSYNPFIYCWLNKNFRHTTISIFCFCFKNNNNNNGCNNNNNHNSDHNNRQNLHRILNQNHDNDNNRVIEKKVVDVNTEFDDHGHHCYQNNVITNDDHKNNDDDDDDRIHQDLSLIDNSIEQLQQQNSSINQCEQQIDSINHIFGCFHRQHSNDDHDGGQQQNDGSHRKRFGTYPQQHYQQYRLKTKSLSIRQEKSIENNNLDDDDDDDDYDGESNTMNTSNF
ncbi:neuropeptide Y receptor, partial [Dermatophagoides farinae]